MAGLISLFVVACLFVHASFALMQESVPEAGSTIAGDEGEENITIICTLLQEAGGPQRITEWFVGTEGEVGDPRVIVDADADYVIVGEPVPNVTDLTYRTNFTILRLTADLDRAVVFCGLGGQNTIFAANFTLRIYRPPTLRDITMQAVQGGVVTTIPLSLDPEAFPFPQQFQWTRNGVVAMNETQRVTYGYPGVTFHAFSRDDSATYNLTATNYHLDNPFMVVGMDMGSLILDVLFPAEIEGSSDTQRAVLEGGDITLVCGDSANGNPTPTISWTDNNGATVSDGPEISGSNTLMLTITNTTRNLAGNWTCTVENSVSSIENQIMLVVVVPPSPPTDISIQSQDIGPTYVRVCWQTPLFLGNPNISRYEITATPVGGGAPVTAGTADNSRDLNVTGLAPGTDYEFVVVAISEFGEVIGSSAQSEPRFANTTFTVPAPVCQGPPTSSGGVITVRWNYAHTGGLDLTQVVVTATKALETSQLAVPNGNLIDLSQMSLEVTTFTAGIEYIFTVTAYNEMGSGTAVCDVVPHLIGIPQVPDTPVGVSNTPGIVLLTLRTPVSGTTPPQMFSFVVNIALASSGTTISRTLEANDYMDGESRQFTIDGLMAGAVYLFSAQAQNEFGSSDFSGYSLVEVAASNAPQITNKPSNPNITLSIGATRTINVMYSQGNPPATVEWRKDGQLISDRRVTTSSTETTLMLTNSVPEVRGRYSVTVSNIRGSDTFVYNVKAEFAPIIDLTQSPTSSGYRLTCTAVGYPILNQVRWETLAGNSVPGSNDIICQSESATFDFCLTSILDIESSSCDRNGYRCIVSNSPRTSSRSISVCPDEPLVLNFINDSPRVQGNNISVDVQTSRPVLTIRCALTGRPSQDCSSGSTTFSNVAPRENDRPYILRIAAITSDRVRTVLRRVVRIEVANLCTIHLINDGVTVSGNSATVEFASTGPSNAFLCSLDRQDPVSCSSGQQLSSLSAGNHRLKIVADNCGSNRHSLVARFIVAEDEA